MKAFRSYFVDASPDAGDTRSLSIGDGNGEITGIDKVENNNDCLWTVRGGKGKIMIRILQPSKITVHDVTGQQIYRQTLPEGVVNLSVPQGLYMVNKKKVMVF